MVIVNKHTIELQNKLNMIEAKKVYLELRAVLEKSKTWENADLNKIKENLKSLEENWKMTEEKYKKELNR